MADAGGKRDTRRRLKSWLDNRLKSKKGWVSSRALSLHGVQEQKLGKQQIFTLANQWKETVYMICTRCLGHVGRVIIAYLLIVQRRRALQEDSREDFLEELSEDYVDIREEHNVKVADLKFLGVDEARGRAPVVDWAGFRVVVQLDFKHPVY